MRGSSGGLIKVMHGEIEEKRYTANSQQRLLSKSTYLADHIAYIDDVMGLHSVGNNQNSPALTLHISTPGNYKAKKFEKSNEVICICNVPSRYGASGITFKIISNKGMMLSVLSCQSVLIQLYLEEPYNVSKSN